MAVVQPFPEHLPRERVVVAAPTSCTCCGSKRLSMVGEDVTETLEVVPRRWNVIQTVREKFTCRDCEKLSQAPAPYHAVPRGWAGPNLLATIVFEKYGQHQPLNRQSDRGGERAAAMSTLIVTAKLNDVDPQAWLADVLARIAELPHTRVHELLPWTWKVARDQTLAA